MFILIVNTAITVAMQDSYVYVVSEAPKDGSGIPRGSSASCTARARTRQATFMPKPFSSFSNRAAGEYT